MDKMNITKDAKLETQLKFVIDKMNFLLQNKPRDWKFQLSFYKDYIIRGMNK